MSSGEVERTADLTNFKQECHCFTNLRGGGGAAQGWGDVTKTTYE